MHMMNDQEYCLRWHKHLTNFAECFEKLLKNESLVDVTLLADGKQFKAHKIVLSVCSTYFQDAFKDLRDKHPIVILKDVKSQHLRALLDFMYRGEVNVSHEELGPIIKTAQSLSIKGLADGLTDNGDVRSSAPMSLIRPKSSDHRRHATPPIPHSSSLDLKPCVRSLPDIYSSPSTSVSSVLPSALAAMPSALTLASPLSLPHLPTFPHSLASTLASNFSNVISHSMAPSFHAPQDMHLSSEGSGDSPLTKRRRRHRRRSGDTVDSGDSDCHSSGSPGDSSVQNLVLPRIPAKIIPLEDLRRHPQPSHQLIRPHYPIPPQLSDSQPRDLSLHGSLNYSLHINSHEHLPQKSPRPPSLVKLPAAVASVYSMELQGKIQKEPENLEHNPTPPHPPSQHQDSSVSVVKEPPTTVQEATEERHKSPQMESSSSSASQRSDERIDVQRPPVKGEQNESEYLVSPAKGPYSHNRHDENSSDNNHFSDDEQDENSSGPRERSSERLSDSTPGPSSSRPHSEEAPHTHNYLGWPYSNEPATEESLVSMAENSGPDYLRAINLVRAAGFGSLLPPRMSPDMLTRPPALGMPLILKGTRDKPISKNILGYPYPETPKQFACEKCGRSYASTGNLKRHKKYECGVEPQFSCPICKKKFQHRHSVKIHVFSTHRNEAGESVPGDPGRDSTGLFSTDGMAAGVPGSCKDDFFSLSQEAPTAGSSQDG